jgi:hypothetical protein
MWGLRAFMAALCGDCVCFSWQHYEGTACVVHGSIMWGLCVFKAALCGDCKVPSYVVSQLALQGYPM